MNIRIKGPALLALAVASTAAQGASETIDYSGSTIAITSESSIGGSGPGPFALSGWVVLSNPLAANATDAVVVPTSWSFNTPEGILSSSFASNPTNVFGSVSGVFEFTTRNGAIVGWDVEASSLYLPGGPTEILSSISSDDFAGTGGDNYQGIEASQYCGQGVLCYTATAASVTPGEWTAVATKVPEVDAASAAAGLTLSMGGLLVFRARRATRGLCYTRAR